MIGRLEGLGGSLNFEFVILLRQIDVKRVRIETKKKQNKIAICSLPLFFFSFALFFVDMNLVIECFVSIYKKRENLITSCLLKVVPENT